MNCDSVLKVSQVRLVSPLSEFKKSENKSSFFENLLFEPLEDKPVAYNSRRSEFELPIMGEEVAERQGTSTIGNGADLKCQDLECIQIRTVGAFMEPSR
jgi:hypothetical protein